MKTSYYTILLGAILLSCGMEGNQKFSLVGSSTELSDGEVIYIENLLTKEVIDTAIVSKGVFSFNTEIDRSPLRVMLRTKSFSQYRFLWLENKPMKFKATPDFRLALVSGSHAEDLMQALQKSINTNVELNRKQGYVAERKFVSENSESIVSIQLLSVYSRFWGKEATDSLFKLFDSDLKATPYGKQIANYLKHAIEPKIGERYVGFKMPDTEGNEQSLEDLEGKITLLEFWASWCKPCRDENENLVRTYRKYHPKGFEIFAVSLDESKKRWLSAIEKDGLEWHHVSELNGDENTAVLIYGVSGIPDNFLIDKEGIIRARNIRGEALNDQLESMFKQ